MTVLMNRDRIKSAIAVALFHALIGWVLIAGLGFSVTRDEDDKLKLFDIGAEPPPPPLVEPAKAEEEKLKPAPENPEGAASPKNLRDTPSPVVVPPPVIKLPVSSPVVAAPIAGQGNAAAAGASDVPGPGTGSGGLGTGTGSDASGDGTGGGGGGGAARQAQWIKGRIKNSDYPKEAWKADAEGVVRVRYVVGTRGRVTHCTVTQSSGRADLDQTTCRLIIERFRYKPARDGAGRPVADVLTGPHKWFLLRDEDPAIDEPFDAGDAFDAR